MLFFKDKVNVITDLKKGLNQYLMARNTCLLEEPNLNHSK